MKSQRSRSQPRKHPVIGMQGDTGSYVSKDMIMWICLLAIYSLLIDLLWYKTLPWLSHYYYYWKENTLMVDMKERYPHKKAWTKCLSMKHISIHVHMHYMCVIDNNWFMEHLNLGQSISDFKIYSKTPLIWYFASLYKCIITSVISFTCMCMQINTPLTK